MNEEYRPHEEQIRHALDQFLDRLAKAVAEVLVRSKPGGQPARRRAAKSPEDETEPTG
jgi:hypothetical protein